MRASYLPERLRETREKALSRTGLAGILTAERTSAGEIQREMRSLTSRRIMPVRDRVGLLRQNTWQTAIPNE